eukprot:11186151-Lingulodinium_polyedra.AAC.1
MLTTESIAPLQETHWTRETETTWSSGLLAHVGVVSAASRLGARQGPQGGVAVLVPAPWRITRREVLVPGCAVAAWASHPGTQASG